MSLNENLKNADSSLLAKAAVAVLVEKKGADIKLYYAGSDNPITDYYVNATARSINHVAALSDEISFQISEAGGPVAKVEGKRGNPWILLDYGDVIVNVFDKDSRAFYNLDRLMPEDGLMDISDIVKAVDEKMKINNTEE